MDWYFFDYLWFLAAVGIIIGVTALLHVVDLIVFVVLQVYLKHDLLLDPNIGNHGEVIQ